MLSLDQYKKLACLLTNSLVIKLKDTANLMNTGLLQSSQYSVPLDKHEWKYYLNLAGKKHFTNHDVKIKLFGTSDIVSLSKQTLDNNPYTKKELRNFNSYYYDLVNEYPEDELYIRGCIYPVDIDKAINAEEGTILSYDAQYVQDNEYSLIDHIQIYVKDFLHRWNVREYTITDTLYYPILLAVLYANLPNKIMSVRNAAIQTNEVHDFHLQHYFNSNSALWENISSFNKQSILWLYNNMEYINKHVGQHLSFDKLLTNLFEPNSIGIGTYTLKKPITADEDVSNLNQPGHTPTKVTTIIRALNPAYLNTDVEVPLKELVEKELDKNNTLNLPIYRDAKDYLLRHEDEVANSYPVTSNETKALDIFSGDVFDPHGIALYNLILDYWIYHVANNSFTYTVDYRDANTTQVGSLGKATSLTTFSIKESQTYICTYKVGLLMLVKILLKATNQLDKKITGITYTHIIDRAITAYDTALSDMWLDMRCRDILAILRDLIPSPVNRFNLKGEYTDYLTKIIDYTNTNWIIDANTEDTLIQMNIKHFNRLIAKADTYNFSNDGKAYTIDQLLAKEGIDYVLPDNFNLSISLQGIVKTFTGVEIDILDKVKEKLANYEALVNKLTSYTVQVITSDNSTLPLYALYNHIGVIHSDNPLYRLIDGEFIPLEPDYVKIKAYSQTVIEDMYSLHLPRQPYIFRCHRPVIGEAVVDVSSKDAMTTTYIGFPTIYAGVIGHPNVDVGQCYFKDEFLWIKKAEFIPYEPMSKTKGGGVDDSPKRNSSQAMPLSPEHQSYDVDSPDMVKGDATLTDSSVSNVETYIPTVGIMPKDGK